MPNSPQYRLISVCILAMATYNVGLFVTKIAPYCYRGYSDFAIFYTAGTIINNGAASNLYDAKEQWKIQREFCDVPIRQGPLLFNHAPFEALIFAPLSRFQYGTAFTLWMAINGTILLLIAFLLRDYIVQWLPRWYLWPLAAIASFPCFMVFVQGQDSLLTALIYTLVFRSLKNSAPCLAGGLLAFTLFKPQLTLPFVAIMFLKKEWRFVMGFAIAASALMVVSILLVGKSAALGYIEFLIKFNKLPVEISAADPKSMATFRGLISFFVDSVESSTMAIGLVIAVSMTGLVFAAKAMRGSIERTFGSYIAVTLFASYHLYLYDLTLLLLPATVIFNQMMTGARISKLIYLYSTGIWFIPMLFFMLDSHLRAILSIILMTGFWGSLWLSQREDAMISQSVQSVSGGV